MSRESSPPQVMQPSQLEQALQESVERRAGQKSKTFVEQVCEKEASYSSVLQAVLQAVLRASQAKVLTPRGILERELAGCTFLVLAFAATERSTALEPPLTIGSVIDRIYQSYFGQTPTRRKVAINANKILASSKFLADAMGPGPMLYDSVCHFVRSWTTHPLCKGKIMTGLTEESDVRAFWASQLLWLQLQRSGVQPWLSQVSSGSPSPARVQGNWYGWYGPLYYWMVKKEALLVSQISQKRALETSIEAKDWSRVAQSVQRALEDEQMERDSLLKPENAATRPLQSDPVSEDEKEEEKNPPRGRGGERRDIAKQFIQRKESVQTRLFSLLEQGNAGQPPASNSVLVPPLAGPSPQQQPTPPQSFLSPLSLFSPPTSGTEPQSCNNNDDDDDILLLPLSHAK